MAKVDFIRVETNEDLENVDIKDGNFIVTGEGRVYVDYDENRVPIGGTPDTEMSDSSTNSVENRVIKEYVDNSISNLPILSNTYGTSNKNGYTQEYINSLNGKTLWENSNPNSNMPNNTIINLLNDDYDVLEIFYKYTTSNNAMWSKKIIKGYNAYLDIATPYYTTSNQVANLYRTFIRNSDTQYTVSHCNITYTSNSSTTHENFIIPIYIVGYKTRLFN